MFSVYDTGTAYHPKAVVTMRWGEFKGTYTGDTEIRGFMQKIIDRVKSGEEFARDREQERLYCDELQKLVDAAEKAAKKAAKGSH